MKISNISVGSLKIKNLAPFFVAVILIIIASEKYGYMSVLKGVGIFSGIVLFNLSIVRFYQEILVFFKMKSWGISTLFTMALTAVIIGIPFVFISYLDSKFLILGSVLSVGVLGALFIYDIVRKMVS